MKAIIGDQTNKIIEINLIWPTYGGFNARRTLLLLSNMRQIAQALDSISFYPNVDYTVLARQSTMKTVYNDQYVHTPFCSWFSDDQKVNSSLLLFHYRSPHLKNCQQMTSGEEGNTRNLRVGEVATREYSMCLYKIIFVFDKSQHNAIYFLLCR